MPEFMKLLRVLARRYDPQTTILLVQSLAVIVIAAFFVIWALRH